MERLFKIGFWILLWASSSIMPVFAETATATFSVTTVVTGTCTISTNVLGFSGTLEEYISKGVRSSTPLGINCTKGLAYDIKLTSTGQSGSTSGEGILKDISVPTNTMKYYLYQDAYTKPWGSMIGVNTKHDVGTGSMKNHTVYGMIPPVLAPGPAAGGTYFDEVMITVVY